MSWQNQAWDNQWIPLETAKPEMYRRVQVWVEIGAIWATWSPNIQAFVGDDNQVLRWVTHWRKGPAETDGLLSGDNNALSD